MSYTIFLMAFAGILAHYLAKYIDTLTTKEAFDWKKHLVFAAYSMIVIVAVLFGWDQIAPVIGYTGELTMFTGFLLGYFADSLVKNLTNFNPFPAKDK